MGYSAYAQFRTNEEASRMTVFMRDHISPVSDIIPFANRDYSFRLADNDDLGYCRHRRTLGFNFSALMEIEYFAMYSLIAWMAFHSSCRRNVHGEKVPYFWYDGTYQTFILSEAHYAKVIEIDRERRGSYFMGDSDSPYRPSRDSYFSLIWERMTLEHQNDVAGLLAIGRVPELKSIMREGGEIDFEPWRHAKQSADESVAAVREELKRLSNLWSEED
jgi:hypothetical protein